MRDDKTESEWCVCVMIVTDILCVDKNLSFFF